MNDIFIADASKLPFIYAENAKKSNVAVKIECTKKISLATPFLPSEVKSSMRQTNRWHMVIRRLSIT
jgi:hypothetical protein